MDVSVPFAKLFAVKDEREIALMKNSAAASVNAWNYLKRKIVDIVDTEKVCAFENLKNLNFSEKAKHLNFFEKPKKTKLFQIKSQKPKLFFRKPKKAKNLKND